MIPNNKIATAPMQRSLHLCVELLPASDTSTADEAAMKGMRTIRATIHVGIADVMLGFTLTRGPVSQEHTVKCERC